MRPRIEDGLTKYQRYARKDPEKRRAQYKAWREANAEKLKAQRKEHYQQNKAQYRFNNAARWYGVGRAEYEAMMKEQGGACAICRRDFSAMKLRRQPSIDHCHASGRVRGILCQRCNLRLAALDDTEWHESATSYLKKSRD